MGIHDLNTFLKTKVPHAFRRLKVETFKGTRIAIDTPLWAFASFSAAYSGYITNNLKNEEMLKDDPFEDETTKNKIFGMVFDRAQMFVCELLKNGITPLFVFDGVAVPEKSSGARQRRKERRDTLLAKIKALKHQIIDADPIFRRNEDFNALRLLMKQIPPINPGADFAKLKSYLKNVLGVPTIVAPDEAEKFCAFLASKGIASACWTTDTDSYLLGAPIVVTGFCEGGKAPVVLNDNEDEEVFTTLTTTKYTPKQLTHFSIVCVPLIFKTLGLTRDQFIDLCIIFGCDFNNRIPKVGPAKAYSLITEALKIDPNAKRLIEIASTLSPTLDWSVLNAERCRFIFLTEDACEEVLKTLSLTKDLVLADVENISDSRVKMTISSSFSSQEEFTRCIKTPKVLKIKR